MSESSDTRVTICIVPDKFLEEARHDYVTCMELLTSFATIGKLSVLLLTQRKPRKTI
jgi:hypothetical protein